MNREENLCWRDFSFFAKPCTVVFIWAQTRTGKQVLIERKHDMLGNQIFEVLQPLSKLLHQSWKVFKFFDMFSINKYGRNFKPGIPQSKDFRNEVIQMVATRAVSETCERYRINHSNVRLPSKSCLCPIRTCFYCHASTLRWKRRYCLSSLFPKLKLKPKYEFKILPGH